MKKHNNTEGKILYGIVFTVLIPAGLLTWAMETDKYINLPVLHIPMAGWALTVFGLFWMLWGMYALYVYGKGLPMNAFPPSKFVEKGPYRWFAHPIYTGFGFLCFGISLIAESSSGLYLVSPVTVLGMISLVLGYESINLHQRFPGRQTRPVFRFPANISGTPEVLERVVVAAGLLLLLIMGNALLQLVNKAPDITPDAPPGWAFPAYCMALILLLLPVASIRDRRILRQYGISMLVALSLQVYTALIYAPLGMSYMMANHHLAIFSIPPSWILLAAWYTRREWPQATIGMLLAAFVVLSAAARLTSDSLLMLLSGVAYFLPTRNPGLSWENIRKSAETIANSWKEWRIGQVRVINHGFYVGAAAFLGALLIGYLVGEAYAWAIVVFGFSGVISAGLWGQFVEGSDKLKRPFGYYGSLAGIVLGSILLKLLGYSVWVIIGSFSVAMPWVQAIGRLRCLVNGCCHGSPTASWLGIRYFHPRSRVCGLSHLKGESLHPTQVYSFLWMFVTGFILLRLWHGGMSYPFIFGLYLLLNGLGRFAEEAYRGEVQTPFAFGLPIYQWTALLTVIVGIGMTCIYVPRATLESGLSPGIFLPALIMGAFTTFAMGIDFPNSNRRFSRLV